MGDWRRWVAAVGVLAAVPLASSSAQGPVPAASAQPGIERNTRNPQDAPASADLLAPAASAKVQIVSPEPTEFVSGPTPLRATIEGAGQIGFTVISISLSLIAAFIPLLFMGGVVGRLFREFSVTLVFAIAISTVVSLSVTPMICAHFVKKPPSPNATWFDRLVEAILSHMTSAMERGENVKISGFGTFLLRDKAQRVGRNPNKPTDTVVIPERAVVKFKSGKILKQLIKKIDVAKL